MKKKLKVTLLFTLLIFSVLLIKSSYAAESTSDFSKVELSLSNSITSTTISQEYEYYYPTVLHIKNAKYDDNYRYIGFVSTENIEINQNDIPNNDISIDPKTTISLTLHQNSSYITGVNFFPRTSKDELYVYIYEYHTAEKTCKKVYSGKIARPDDIGLTRRFKAYFFDERTSVYNYSSSHGQFKEGIFDSMNVSIKIGKIDNLQLLRDIKNQKSDSMSNLLKYAKEDESPLYTTAIRMTDTHYSGDPLPLSGKIANDQYYYVYFNNGGSDSTYHHIEDVNLYYGLVSDSVGTNLFSYYDSQFKWNLAEQSSDEQKQPSRLPDTGDIKLIIFASVTMILIVCAIILKKKSKTN